jgi:hypothetical protein
VNFFAPTVSAPQVARTAGFAVALTDGSVLVGGGVDSGGAVLAGTESYSPQSGQFTVMNASLAHARTHAQAIEIAGIGTLVLGGLDGSGVPIAAGELYLESQAQFLSVSDSRLEGRVGHRLVELPDGRVFLSGGKNSDGTVLGTTLIIYVASDGSYQITDGSNLTDARREHATVVAGGVPMVFGGYDDCVTPPCPSTGRPLATIETLPLGRTGEKIDTTLKTARAGATASLLEDGTILIVGGVGADETPLATAEVFNPVDRSTTVYAMSTARTGHTATVLAGGRVLVTGGRNATGDLSSVELFAPGVGFLTERSLGTARSGHDAVSLCDGTVLIVGGAATAEVYAPPAS